MDTPSLAPSLLLAMPQMFDPNFARSVVLVCEHGEGGTLGLVVNRPTTTAISAVVRLDTHDERQAADDVMVWMGGPVETGRAWILSAIDPDPDQADYVSISDGLFLAASAQALRGCLEAPEAARHRYRFLLGYAGWAAGQLESELAASAWLNAPVDVSLIFDTPAERMWETAIRALGIDPNALHMGPGVH